MKRNEERMLFRRLCSAPNRSETGVMRMDVFELWDKVRIREKRFWRKEETAIALRHNCGMSVIFPNRCVKQVNEEGIAERGSRHKDAG